MSASESVPTPTGKNRAVRTAQVIVVSSVMFTFISYWRTAAVVLCDLASTAYYIGGIVEQSIGPAAPWFILAVMLFSYAVRSVYIESCALFVRGGVYRIVREALGGFPARLAVSALMFDYILTGPISSVSAGQYIIGLGLEVYQQYGGGPLSLEAKDAWKRAGSVVIACAITLYFFRQNILGIHESSGKALKIMVATTIMAVIMLVWCGVTLWIDGAKNAVPLLPDFHERMNPTTEQMEDPLGFLGGTGLAEALRSLEGVNWLTVIGLIGIFIAFGHSILAMSGEETLAQVYREVESPKLQNFRKAAFIVFIYSLILTAGISFLAVLLIPNDVRMKEYGDNLIGGLAMSVSGPPLARLLLNAFVVVIGSLILAGAVNTAIIGSNGVLNRVAEDGVMPDWFLKPHPKFGTTYRMLYLIVGLQLVTIIASRGDVLLLGEAYAFGVVWSFVFMALAMLVLRFRRPGPREAKVPLNIQIGRIEIPIGLGLIFLVLLFAAITNLLTKEVATIGGLVFTGAFLIIFTVTEHYHRKRLHGTGHEHLEQFNRQVAENVTPESLALTKPYRKLVAIRSPHNLFMLEQALAEMDPETTEVVVMTAKVAPADGSVAEDPAMDQYDQRLMTAVVSRAEKAGKRIIPLIIPTNNPLYAVLRTAKAIGAQELIMGASNKFTADEQLDQIAFYWISLQEGKAVPLTVRILSRGRDIYSDLEGGSRIPKISERQARSVAELRAAGVGIDKVLVVHDGKSAGRDLFWSVLTMLDPAVILDVVTTTVAAKATGNGPSIIEHDQERAHHLGREVQTHTVDGVPGAEIAKLARQSEYDLIVINSADRTAEEPPWPDDKAVQFLLRHAHCPVFLAVKPEIPQEVEE